MPAITRNPSDAVHTEYPVAVELTCGRGTGYLASCIASDTAKTLAVSEAETFVSVADDSDRIPREVCTCPHCSPGPEALETEHC